MPKNYRVIFSGVGSYLGGAIITAAEAGPELDRLVQLKALAPTDEPADSERDSGQEGDTRDLLNTQGDGVAPDGTPGPAMATEGMQAAGNVTEAGTLDEKPKAGKK